MKHNNLKIYFFAFVLFFSAVLALSTQEAKATHFRYGHLTWQKVTGNTARFTLINAFRRDGYLGSAPDGFPAVNDIINENIGGTVLFFGDFTNTSVLSYKVISIDVANNWLLAIALENANNPAKESIDHTYPTATNAGAPWVAQISSCCRTSTEINNPDGNYTVSTSVELASGNRSPVSSMLPIINVSQSANSQFLVPAADSDPNTFLTYRLAATGEAGFGFNQPSGLTIDPLTGQVSWNTLGAIVGGYYSCQVIIEDRSGSITGPIKTQVAVDFLIYINPQVFPCDVNVAPSFVAPSDPNGTIYTVQEGLGVSFSVNTSDADAGNVIILNSAGIPSGATFTTPLPSSGNPVGTTFNWTPSIGQAGAYVITFSATDSCGLQALRSYTVNVTPAPVNCRLTASISNTKTTCYGSCDGTLTANPSKGIAPYIYLWSNGQTTKTITGLCKGPYTVTVTDAAGCTVIKSCAVSSPSRITISCGVVNVKCKGSCTGSITANAAGGSGTGYSYVWSTGATTNAITNLCKGTYTVTVTDSRGCTSVITKNITEPSKVLATTISKTTCSTCYPNCNGTATANPTGGVTPYTYLWSNSATTKQITGLCAGTYTVTVTDKNGCTVVNQTTIASTCCAISLTPTIESNTNCTPCNGSINVVASGGSGSYHYNWSNGATTSGISALCAGSYTVTVTDNQSSSCIATATYSVNDDIDTPTPDVREIAIACHNDCNGGGIVLNDFEFSSIVWSNGDIGANASDFCPGQYSVVVTAYNGCTAAGGVDITNPDKLEAFCSLINNESGAGNNDGALAGSATGGLQPQNYDYLWSDGQTTANATGLSAGVYTLTVTDGYGCVATTSCSIITEEECDGDFTTYTQGGWGNTGAPGQYMAANFENCFGSIVIGDPCGYTITLTEVDAVRDFLPQGSTAAALTQSYTDPGSANITVLAGQVLGVAFALGFDDCDANFGGSPTDLGLQVYNNPNSPFHGWNIQAIFDTSSKILAGCPSLYTPVDANEACTDVNENYDEGANNGLFVCPGSTRLNSSNETETLTTVFPNPFDQTLIVKYKGEESFNVTISDLSGRIVEVINAVVNQVEVGKKLQSGVYMVTLQSENGYRSASRIVKN